MKRNFFRLFAVLGVLGLYAACSDNSTVAPTGRTVPKPSYDATNPFNNDGFCMYRDASEAPTGTISGVKQGDDTLTIANCTSNDVTIATAQLQAFAIADAQGNFPAPTPYVGQQVQCPEGRAIQLTMAAKLNENASSTRYDIGVWLATDGGSGKFGACKHFNLLPGGGVTNEDGDVCGDLTNKAQVPNFDLGTFNSVCETTATSGDSLHIGSCLGWTEVGANRVCPVPSITGPNGFRFGTLYGNKSKCNCEGFNVPIVIEKTAKLEVAKVCDPTTDAGTFDLLIDNSNSPNGDNKTCGTGTGAQTVSAGTNVSPGAVHTFGEGDFTTANYTSSYSCVNRLATGPQHVFTASGDAAATGTSLGPNQITMQPGEDVVCTYTNARKPTLTLAKHVVNDNGGTANASAWTLTATGSGGFTGTGSPATGADASLGPNIVTAGVQYTLSESGGPSAYTAAAAWVCTGTGGTFVSPNKITVANGGDVTCTITNDDNAAHLIVIKHVINDNGGSAVAGDFTETISGVTASGGQAVTGTESPGVDKTLTSVGSYSVTEGTHTGYAVTYSADCNATIALGETKTCTVTNDDIAAHLIVIKHVINDNGGSAVAGDFTETISGVTASGGQAVTGTESPGVDKTLTTVGSYSVTEGTHTGYAVSYSADCNATIALGETKTCTVTNDDIAAHLIVIKHVINDNGGSKTAADFTMTISGVTTSGTNPFAGAESPGVDNTLTSVGSFTVTEGAVSGYTQTSAVGCSGTIALGETKTCTITNDDNVPPPTGAIAPTNTTCADYVSKNFTPLTTLFAQLTKGNIQNVSPGVFFYYANVTLAASGPTGFTESVQNNAGILTPLNLYTVAQGQAFVYTVSGGVCTKVATLTLNAAGTGGTSGTLPAGNYILGVKFSTDAQKGLAENPTPVLLATHSFDLLGGGSHASVNTQVKQ